MFAETALLPELWTADVAPADDLSALEAAAPSAEAPSAEAVVSLELWDWLPPLFALPSLAVQPSLQGTTSLVLEPALTGSRTP